ncbi:MAG: hypothetical protein HYX75_03500 [Acidobacteria bacterium]|nr:hypothetical protein [Acidobacteriota bacterium]
MNPRVLRADSGVTQTLYGGKYYKVHRAIADEYVCPIVADVNGNRTVDAGDVLFIAQAVAGLRTLTPAQQNAADVNCYAGLDVVDVLFYAQYVAGVRTSCQ